MASVITVVLCKAFCILSSNLNGEAGLNHVVLVLHESSSSSPARPYSTQFSSFCVWSAHASDNRLCFESEPFGTYCCFILVTDLVNLVVLYLTYC